MTLSLRSFVVPTRTVFLAYAWVASATAAVAFFEMPQLWFKAILPLGVGCLAAVLARLPDPLARRRALLGFSAVHLMGLANVVAWYLIPHGADSFGRSFVVLAVYMVSYVLARWMLREGPSEKTDRIVTRLFGDPPPQVDSPLRVAYEREIREAATQAERNRLARELHDSIKQEIFAMHTSAATAQERFDSDPDGARRALEQVRTSARDAVAEMDALLDQLRATPLSLAGLMASLEKQCDALSLRTGATIAREMGVMPSEAELPPGVTQAFFRIAQEALSNIARHARASHVAVSLGRKEQRFQLLIEDDGAGFERDREPAGGMGIGNMQARARDIGGLVAINSAPGKGTKVVVAVPLLPVVNYGGAQWWNEHRWLQVGMFGSLLLIVPLTVVAVWGGFRQLYADLRGAGPTFWAFVTVMSLQALFVLAWRFTRKRR